MVFTNNNTYIEFITHTKDCPSFFSDIAVNGFKLNHKRQIVTFLLQIKNGVDVIVIPISYF